MFVTRLSLCNLALLGVVALMGQVAHAEESVEQSVTSQAAATSTSVTGDVAPAERKSKLFYMDTLFIASTSLHGFDDPRKSSFGDLLLVPRLHIGDWRPMAMVQINQAMNGLVRDPIVAATLVGLGHKAFDLNPYLRISPNLWITLPFSANARERVSLLAAVMISQRISYDLGRKGLPISGFYEPSVTRSFHEFKTTTTGASNAAYSFGQRLIIGVDLGAGFIFNTDLILGHSWTYEGNTVSRFSWSEGIDKNLGQGWSAGVAFSNAGPTLRANGYDSNVSLVDPETSQISGSVSYAF
jgi:hypothetical protein